MRKQAHLLGTVTYAELARDDPNRNTYLQSVTLRTALMESYMAFKVADLVSGVGAIIALLGLSQVVLGLYLGFVATPEREPVTGGKAALGRA